MLSLSPRHDLFRFLLPKEFMPQELYDKYMVLFQSNPGVITNPIDYLNESIKGITIPGISEINSEQLQVSYNSITRSNIINKGTLGRINIEPEQKNQYVSTANPLSLIERKFKVTFRQNQGLYNYFMLYETLFHRICKPINYQQGDDFVINILNESGDICANLKLFQCHMEGIDELEFGFDKVTRESDDFDVSWVFNNIDFEFVVPSIS